MSDKTLIDNDLFVISVFLLGIPLIITTLIGKDYSNVIDFLKYTIPSVASVLLIGIVAICILTYAILKIFHLIQYLLVRKRMSLLKQKELAIKQNQQDNLNTLRREMQNIFLEAKPLLNAENTLENKKKLEKILEELLQPKYNNLNLHNQRLSYIDIVSNKAKRIGNYLQSKEKEKLEWEEQVKKELNIEKGYIKKGNLSTEKIKVLIKEGLNPVKCVELDDSRTFIYFLKPRANESPQHFFLTMIVADYLKSLGITVETPNSREADIIFEIDGVKWAVEVETGSYPKKSPEEFNEKVKNLNEKYGSKWIFLVTNTELTIQYKKLNEHTYNRHEIKRIIKNIIEGAMLRGEKNRQKFAPQL